MEVQLQELIEQIKKEGVEVAEKEAKKIIATAESQAEKIVSNAQDESAKIIANAKAEAERIAKASEEAIRQAGRNMLISFRESVARELKTLLEEEVSKVYSSSEVCTLILKVVENWSKNSDSEDLAVILNSEDLSRLEDGLIKGVKERVLSGVTLRPSDNFDGGFRILVGDSGAYYDYSVESVVDMISNYLSPKVVKLLKEAE